MQPLRQLSRFCSQHAASSKWKEFTLIKRFTQGDLDRFTELTNDYNPIHSIETPLEHRKVHGALLNAVVAGVMGTKLPGPGTVVLEQKCSFPNPCRLNVETMIWIRLLKERKISIVEYECRQGDDIVFQGEAKLLTRKHDLVKQL